MDVSSAKKELTATRFIIGLRPKKRYS